MGTDFFILHVGVAWPGPAMSYISGFIGQLKALWWWQQSHPSHAGLIGGLERREPSTSNTGTIFLSNEVVANFIVYYALLKEGMSFGPREGQ